jgi:hypothetical protein
VPAGTQCEGFPCSGLIPPQCPAVRRNGNTALMCAAAYDHPAIVQKLVDARADVTTRNNHGCAFPPARSAALSAVADGAPIAPRPSGRGTALHFAAFHGCTKSAVPLLVGAADQSITDKYGYACAAHGARWSHTDRPESAQGHASPTCTT